MSCPRCDLGDHGTKKRPDGIKHVATEERPSLEELEAMIFDGTATATDGCTVEPDGRCPHGHASWLLVIGAI